MRGLDNRSIKSYTLYCTEVFGSYVPFLIFRKYDFVRHERNVNIIHIITGHYFGGLKQTKKKNNNKNKTLFHYFPWSQ